MSYIGYFKTEDGTTTEAGKRIFDDNGFDVTPKPLSYTAPQRQHRKSSVRSRYEENEMEARSRLELPKKWSKEGPLAFKASSVVTSEPPEKDYLKELETVKENLKTAKLDMEEATVKPASAVLYLEESVYFWHLHMPSTNFVRTQDSEAETEHDKRGRRYRLPTAVQTFNPVNKKKMSQTVPIEMSTSCVFASEWDLYDTYRRLSYEDEEAGNPTVLRTIHNLDFDDLDIEVYGAEVSLQMASSLQRQSINSDSRAVTWVGRPGRSPRAPRPGGHRGSVGFVGAAGPSAKNGEDLIIFKSVMKTP